MLTPWVYDGDYEDLPQRSIWDAIIAWLEELCLETSFNYKG